jgi:heme/copper-type cytochrome/quinol oxidase subunit 2
MTTKKAVILTIVIILLALVLGLGVMFALVDISSSQAEQQVAKLGQFTGFATVVPIFVVWVMWGLQMRKQNEQKPTQSKSKRQGRS